MTDGRVVRTECPRCHALLDIARRADGEVTAVPDKPEAIPE